MPDVILGNGNTAELPDDMVTIGDAAQKLAHDAELAGDIFTLKVNGDVVDPSEMLNDAIHEDDPILELIEHVEQDLVESGPVDPGFVSEIEGEELFIPAVDDDEDEPDLDE